MTKEQEDSIYAIKFAVMQQQIDKLKKHNNNLLRKLRNRVKEVKKLKKYSLYKEEFSRLNKQLQNKDQIIDLMAKVINEAYFESEDFEEWFENKICKVQRDEDYTYLEKDIKRYFENTENNKQEWT